MKIKQLILYLFLFVFSSSSSIADSIGFSFNSDRDDSPMPNDAVAGVVPSDGWVSTVGGNSASAGANGSITNRGVRVDWSSNGTWNTNNGKSNADNLLMNGYIDAIGGAGSAQIIINDINNAFNGSYDLYVYFGSDGNDRTGKIELEGGKTYSFRTFSQQGGNFPAQYERTTDTGNGNPRSNYALFEGLTGDSQTLNLIRGSSNSGFHGIQIVGTEDPGLASVELQSATLVRSDSARIRGRVTNIGNDEPSITFYFGTSDAGTDKQNWEDSVTLPGKYSASFSAQLNNLEPGTEYFFRALASNSVGDSWSPNSLSFETRVASPEIVNLTASQIDATSVTMGAQVMVTGGEDPEVIIYYGRSDGGKVPAGWESSKNLGVQSGVTNISVSGLQQNTKYFFRAFAQNSGGSDWSEFSGSFLTEKISPPAVSNRTASNISGSTANLRGTVSDSGGSDPSISFYFGPADGGVDPSAWARSVDIGTQKGDFSFFVSGLDPLTKYYYRIFASNPGGAIWSSETVQFETTDSNVSEIVINEIHYDVPDKTLRAEFVELYNPTDSAVDLSGWRLSSAVNYTFPNGTSIQAGGFLVIAEDPQTILSEWGVNSIGPWT
ncbi:MAG: lamin tail domain-containing protein, partial [Verrucomicrobiales bacterium]|nr:lamin tail domain-containing protein [Verrucomicrobiales bacterium]